MDIELTQRKDARGNAIIDFSLGITPTQAILPVRNEVWILDEMSDPDRFEADIANEQLNCEDLISYVYQQIWVIYTDAERRNNFVVAISGTKQESQRAIVAAMLQVGTIPSLPDTGNFIAELLTDQVTPAQFNNRVIENIKDLANSVSFKPSYDLKNGELSMSIVRA